MMDFDKYEKKLNEIINDQNVDEANKKAAEADLLVVKKYKESNSMFLKAYLENVIKSEKKMMDNFFIVKKRTRTVQKEETYDYKRLDDRKVFAAIEEATTVNELIQLLKVLQEDDDTELDHIIADNIVAKALRMLDQNELVEEYEKIHKWYSRKFQSS